MASDTPLPPIPPNIAMITGPTMVGICLNWGLMGVLVVQVYFYHLHFPNDGKWTKSLVYGLILLDVLQTCMITADAFHWFVYGFGNMIQLDDTFLNSWDVCLLDAVISLIVQAFYCYRIWVLRARSYIWPTLIMIVSVTQAVAGIVTAVNAYKLHKLSLIHTEVIEQTTWLVGSALADVLITAVIGWTLLKKRNNELQSSKKMLVRLVRLTVETNALTASVAVIGLIFFLALPQHATLVVPPTAIMGKLYTNCFIAVLNNRAIVKEAGSRYNTNTSGLQSFRMNEPADRPGVHVHVLRDVKADSDNARDGKEVAIEMERI